MMDSNNFAKEFNEMVLSYYDLNKRSLPWRETTDPYAKWISEIMCQQTQVATVIPYYNRFMARMPDVYHLSQIEEDELLKLWQGLGYYNRARNLKKAALIIVNNYQGVFPKEYDELVKLPGIGDYTASAILSMAYDEAFVTLDGNFMRVFSRVLLMDNDISLLESKTIFKEAILPFEINRCGDFNQAIMDLGATICLPNEEPRCEQCPVSKFCQAYQKDKTTDYPVSSKVTKVKEVALSLFIIKVNENYVLRKRGPEGLLASLYEFPNVTKKLTIEQVKKLFSKATSITIEKTKYHHFTHQTWVMTPFVIHFNKEDYDLKEGEFFASMDEIKNKYAIPKAFNQFNDLL